MKLPDPLALKLEKPRDTTLFAASLRQGERETQEDYFINFNDECFVVADGVGGMPHGEVAAKLAAETAIWAYKHIRQRRFYWLDKKLFMKHVFRTTNLTIWQKQREKGFTDGLATTLLVMMTGPRSFWLGHVGDSSAWLLRNGKLINLTPPDVDQQGYLTRVLGNQRLGLIPHFRAERFLVGDTILLATDGVTNYLKDEELKEILSRAGETSQSLTQAVMKLLSSAQDHESRDNMTACIIKRIATK